MLFLEMKDRYSIWKCANCIEKQYTMVCILVPVAWNSNFSQNTFSMSMTYIMLLLRIEQCHKQKTELRREPEITGNGTPGQKNVTKMPANG